MSKCKVISMDRQGAVFIIDGERKEVSFEECAKNFKIINAGAHRCVAARDITKFCFIFYSEPRLTVTISGITRFQRTRKFHDLQKQILKNGYTTFDMS